MRCDVCENSPIKYVSIIRHSDGPKLRVGNECIDSLTNLKVSEWFRDFITKRENVIRNRKYIDWLASILTAYRSSELVFQMPENDGEKLQEEQEHLSEHYISKDACT